MGLELELGLGGYVVEKSRGDGLGRDVRLDGQRGEERGERGLDVAFGLCIELLQQHLCQQPPRWKQTTHTAHTAHGENACTCARARGRGEAGGSVTQNERLPRLAGIE
jgi:hypothetical protein